MSQSRGRRCSLGGVERECSWYPCAKAQRDKSKSGMLEAEKSLQL